MNFDVVLFLRYVLFVLQHTTIGSDVSAKLALVSVFTQYGGANFDTVTNTPTIATLLSGLGYEAIVAHLHLLVGVVASSASNVTVNNNTNAKDKTDDADEDSDSEDSAAEEMQASEAISALDALISLAKNASIAHRGLVCCTVATVLCRLSAFGVGTAHLAKSSEKTDKKGGQKRKSSAGDLGENLDLSSPLHYYTALTASTSANVGTSSVEVKTTFPLPPAAAAAVEILDTVLAASPVPALLATAAGGKLLSLLADLGNFTLMFLDTPMKATADAVGADGTEKEKTKEVEDGTPTLLQCAWQAVWQMHSQGLPMRVAESDEEGSWEDLPGLLKTITVLLHMKAVAGVDGENSGRGEALTARTTDSLHALLAQTSFHAIISQTVDVQVCFILLLLLYLFIHLFKFSYTLGWKY